MAAKTGADAIVVSNHGGRQRFRPVAHLSFTRGSSRLGDDPIKFSR